MCDCPNVKRRCLPHTSSHTPSHVATSNVEDQQRDIHQSIAVHGTRVCIPSRKCIIVIGSSSENSCTNHLFAWLGASLDLRSSARFFPILASSGQGLSEAECLHICLEFCSPNKVRAFEVLLVLQQPASRHRWLWVCSIGEGFERG